MFGADGSGESWVGWSKKVPGLVGYFQYEYIPPPFGSK